MLSLIMWSIALIACIVLIQVVIKISRKVYIRGYSSLDEAAEFFGTVKSEIPDERLRHRIYESARTGLYKDVLKRGVTLIELLVVITIMTILSAILIPRLPLWNENRAIREAARATHVFLYHARTRAIESGRPCGVLLESASGRPNTCVTLRHVEQPPLYSGDLTTSYTRFRWVSVPLPSGQPGPLLLRCQLSQGGFSPNLVRRGDLIKINYQGQFYRIIDDITNNNDYPINNSYIDFTQEVSTKVEWYPQTPKRDPITQNIILDINGDWVMETGSGTPVIWVTEPWLTLEPLTNPITPFPTLLHWSLEFAPISITLTPHPVNRMLGGTSLQLPRLTCVDLQFSGVGDSNQCANVSSIIMFNTSGDFSTLYYGSQRATITAPISLLIGKTKRVDLSLLPDDNLNNWRDLTNLWVTVNRQGSVGGGEVAVGNSFDESRRLARESQIASGGR